MNPAKHGKFLKIVSCVFAFIILFTYIPKVEADYAETSFPGTTETRMVAVNANAAYTVSLKNAVYVKGNEDDGKILTDAKYSTPYKYGAYVDGWVMIKSSNGNSDFKVTVDMDMGYIAKGLNTFYSRNYKRNGLGVGFPKSVKFYISNDGTNFEYIGDATTTTNTSLSSATAIYRLITESKLSARYVRAVFECDGSKILYINEICVAAESNAFYASYAENGRIIDQQGLIYSLDGKIAKVTGIIKKPQSSVGKIKPSNANFNKDDEVYVIGKGSNNEVTVISDFIDINKDNYSGAPNMVTSIIIHNTGTTHESTDAERYNKRMHNTTDTSSWHYTVDDKIIYHSMPDQIAAWHSGPSHNYESIGIEMCVNGAPTDYKGNPVFEGRDYDNWVNNRFIKTIKNTAMLTAELLTRYGLDTSAVGQHYDATEKNCPMWLRADGDGSQYDGKLWKVFIEYVEKYYKLLNGKDPVRGISPSKNIVIPDYVIAHGQVYPVTVIDEDAFAELGDAIESFEVGSMVEKIYLNGFDGSHIQRFAVNKDNKNFYISTKGNLCNSKRQVIYYVTGWGSKVITPKPKGNLDIRKIGSRYFLFLTGTDYTVEKIEKLYGSKVTEALNVQRNPMKSNEKVFTDVRLTFEDGARIYAVLRGDADGDGKITSRDYVMTKRMYFGTYAGNQRQISAAALKNGETIVAKDYVSLKRHYFGTFNIFK